MIGYKDRKNRLETERAHKETPLCIAEHFGLFGHTESLLSMQRQALLSTLLILPQTYLSNGLHPLLCNLLLLFQSAVTLLFPKVTAIDSYLSSQHQVLKHFHLLIHSAYYSQKDLSEMQVRPCSMVISDCVVSLHPHDQVQAFQFGACPFLLFLLIFPASGLSTLHLTDDVAVQIRS